MQIKPVDKLTLCMSELLCLCWVHVTHFSLNPPVWWPRFHHDSMLQTLKCLEFLSMTLWEEQTCMPLSPNLNNFQLNEFSSFLRSSGITLAFETNLHYKTQWQSLMCLSTGVAWLSWQFLCSSELEYDNVSGLNECATPNDVVAKGSQFVQVVFNVVCCHFVLQLQWELLGCQGSCPDPAPVWMHSHHH